MAQVTIYFPDELEKQVRMHARDAGLSLSGYIARTLSRAVAPPGWPKALRDVLESGYGDIAEPEDRLPEDREPIA